jgi:hypothetical protein
MLWRKGYEVDDNLPFASLGWQAALSALQTLVQRAANGWIEPT